MISRRQILLLFAGGLLILGVGAFGFAYLERISLFDSLWLTVITILTVGYGDLVPHTLSGKFFALFIIPVGIAFFTYAAGTVMSGAIEGIVSQKSRRRRMARKVDELRNHIIVCGYGRVGQQVVYLLEQENIPVVVVEQDPAVLEKIYEETLYVEGDATDDEILKKAGIMRANGVVLAIANDASNVMITLTAKGLNPQVQVVARAERIFTEEKLMRAGADKVINPSSIGGRRMAMSILKPNSVEYIETILQSKYEEFRIEEILIHPGSPLAGKTLAELQIREAYGVNIVGLTRGKEITSNPSGEIFLQANDVIIAAGSAKQLAEFEALARGKEQNPNQTKR